MGRDEDEVATEGATVGRVLALTLEYDGTDYRGFQVQAEGPTIQAEVERALERLTGEPVRVAGAGRTDAGVHATGQVVSFATASRHEPATIQRALNALLPGDVRVLWCATKRAGFHARFSAKSRAYRYTIVNRAVSPAIGRRYVHHVGARLDLDRLATASERLIGEHDFVGFAGAGAEGVTIRRLTRATWRKAGERLVFEVEANAFLPHMVRNLVGTLIDIGRGHRPVEQVEQILERRDRKLAGPTAPACGLCLVKVRY